ncbi:hypothetical protein ACFLTD_00890, partial [Elusimicrobiota bacterium]
MIGDYITFTRVQQVFGDSSKAIDVRLHEIYDILAEADILYGVKGFLDKYDKMLIAKIQELLGSQAKSLFSNSGTIAAQWDPVLEDASDPDSIKPEAAWYEIQLDNVDTYDSPAFKRYFVSGEGQTEGVPLTFEYPDDLPNGVYHSRIRAWPFDPREYVDEYPDILTDPEYYQKWGTLFLIIYKPQQSGGIPASGSQEGTTIMSVLLAITGLFGFVLTALPAGAMELGEGIRIMFKSGFTNVPHIDISNQFIIGTLLATGALMVIALGVIWKLTGRKETKQAERTEEQNVSKDAGNIVVRVIVALLVLSLGTGIFALYRTRILPIWNQATDEYKQEQVIEAEKPSAALNALKAAEADINKSIKVLKERDMSKDDVVRAAVLTIMEAYPSNDTEGTDYQKAMNLLELFRLPVYYALPDIDEQHYAGGMLNLEKIYPWLGKMSAYNYSIAYLLFQVHHYRGLEPDTEYVEFVNEILAENEIGLHGIKPETLINLIDGHLGTPQALVEAGEKLSETKAGTFKSIGIRTPEKEKAIQELIDANKARWEEEAEKKIENLMIENHIPKLNGYEFSKTYDVVVLVDPTIPNDLTDGIRFEYGDYLVVVSRETENTPLGTETIRHEVNEYILEAEVIKDIVGDNVVEYLTTIGKEKELAQMILTKDHQAHVIAWALEIINNKGKLTEKQKIEIDRIVARADKKEIEGILTEDRKESHRKIIKEYLLREMQSENALNIVIETNENAFRQRLVNKLQEAGKGSSTFKTLPNTGFYWNWKPVLAAISLVPLSALMYQITNAFGEETGEVLQEVVVKASESDNGWLMLIPIAVGVIIAAIGIYMPNITGNFYKAVSVRTPEQEERLQELVKEKNQGWKNEAYGKIENDEYEVYEAPVIRDVEFKKNKIKVVNIVDETLPEDLTDGVGIEYKNYLIVVSREPGTTEFGAETIRHEVNEKFLTMIKTEIEIPAEFSGMVNHMHKDAVDRNTIEKQYVAHIIAWALEIIRNEAELTQKQRIEIDRIVLRGDQKKIQQLLKEDRNQFHHKIIEEYFGKVLLDTFVKTNEKAFRNELARKNQDISRLRDVLRDMTVNGVKDISVPENIASDPLTFTLNNYLIEPKLVQLNLGEEPKSPSRNKGPLKYADFDRGADGIDYEINVSWETLGYEKDLLELIIKLEFLKATQFAYGKNIGTAGEYARMLLLQYNDVRPLMNQILTYLANKSDKQKVSLKEIVVDRRLFISNLPEYNLNRKILTDYMAKKGYSEDSKTIYISRVDDKLDIKNPEKVEKKGISKYLKTDLGIIRSIVLLLAIVIPSFALMYCSPNNQEKLQMIKKLKYTYAVEEINDGNSTYVDITNEQTADITTVSLKTGGVYGSPLFDIVRFTERKGDKLYIVMERAARHYGIGSHSYYVAVMDMNTLRSSDDPRLQKLPVEEDMVDMGYGGSSKDRAVGFEVTAAGVLVIQMESGKVLQQSVDNTEKKDWMSVTRDVDDTLIDVNIKGRIATTGSTLLPELPNIASYWIYDPTNRDERGKLQLMKKTETTAGRSLSYASGAESMPSGQLPLTEGRINLNPDGTFELDIEGMKDHYTVFIDVYKSRLVQVRAGDLISQDDGDYLKIEYLDYDESDVAELKEMLQSTSYQERLDAAKVAGDINDPRLIEALAEASLVPFEYGEVRIALARSLGKLGMLLRSDRDSEAYRKVIETLKRVELADFYFTELSYEAQMEARDSLIKVMGMEGYVEFMEDLMYRRYSPFYNKYYDYRGDGLGDIGTIALVYDYLRDDIFETMADYYSAIKTFDGMDRWLSVVNDSIIAQIVNNHMETYMPEILDRLRNSSDERVRAGMARMFGNIIAARPEDQKLLEEGIYALLDTIKTDTSDFVVKGALWSLGNGEFRTSLGSTRDDVIAVLKSVVEGQNSELHFTAARSLLQVTGVDGLYYIVDKAIAGSKEFRNEMLMLIVDSYSYSSGIFLRGAFTEAKQHLISLIFQVIASGDPASFDGLDHKSIQMIDINGTQYIQKIKLYYYVDTGEIHWDRYEINFDYEYDNEGNVTGKYIVEYDPDRQERWIHDRGVWGRFYYKQFLEKLGLETDPEMKKNIARTLGDMFMTSKGGNIGVEVINSYVENFTDSASNVKDEILKQIQRIIEHNPEGFISEKYTLNNKIETDEAGRIIGITLIHSSENNEAFIYVQYDYAESWKTITEYYESGDFEIIYAGPFSIFVDTLIDTLLNGETKDERIEAAKQLAEKKDELGDMKDEAVEALKTVLLTDYEEVQLAARDALIEIIGIAEYVDFMEELLTTSDNENYRLNAALEMGDIALKEGGGLKVDILKALVDRFSLEPSDYIRLNITTVVNSIINNELVGEEYDGLSHPYITVTHDLITITLKHPLEWRVFEFGYDEDGIVTGGDDYEIDIDWQAYEGVIVLDGFIFGGYSLSEQNGNFSAYAIRYAFERGGNGVVTNTVTVNFTQPDGSRINKAELEVIISTLDSLSIRENIDTRNGFGHVKIDEGGALFWTNMKGGETQYLNMIEIAMYMDWVVGSLLDSQESVRANAIHMLGQIAFHEDPDRMADIFHTLVFQYPTEAIEDSVDNRILLVDSIETLIFEGLSDLTENTQIIEEDGNITKLIFTYPFKWRVEVKYEYDTEDQIQSKSIIEYYEDGTSRIIYDGPFITPASEERLLKSSAGNIKVILTSIMTAVLGLVTAGIASAEEFIGRMIFENGDILELKVILEQPNPIEIFLGLNFIVLTMVSVAAVIAFFLFHKIISVKRAKSMGNMIMGAGSGGILWGIATAFHAPDLTVPDSMIGISGIPVWIAYLVVGVTTALITGILTRNLRLPKNPFLKEMQLRLKTVKKELNKKLQLDGKTKELLSSLMKDTVLYSDKVKQDDKSFMWVRARNNRDRGPAEGDLKYVYSETLTDEFYKEFDKLKNRMSVDELNSFLENWIKQEAKALSLGMSLKNALAGLPLGGGKAVLLLARVEEIDGEKKVVNMIELLKNESDYKSASELAEITREMGYQMTKSGDVRYDKSITAPDVNTNGTVMTWLIDGHIKALTDRPMKEIGEKLDKLDELRAGLDEEQEDPLLTPYFDKALELGLPETGTFTGKPEDRGGILLRAETAALANYYIIKESIKYLAEEGKLGLPQIPPFIKGAMGSMEADEFEKASMRFRSGIRYRTAAIQGYDNTGSHLHRLLAKDKAIIQAVSDSAGGVFRVNGFDHDALARFNQIYGSVTGIRQDVRDRIEVLGKLKMDSSELRDIVGIKDEMKFIEWYKSAVTEDGELKTNDMLVHEYLHGAKLITNGELLELDVDILVPAALDNVIIKDNRVETTADSIVSHYEWVQNLTDEQWNVASISNMLEKTVQENFRETVRVSNGYNVDLRTAGDILAVKRIHDSKHSRVIGVPKEIKQGENRVGLTPRGVKAMTSIGRRVIVEKNAGLGSGYTNADYAAAGAIILPGADEVWKAIADEDGLIIKVKEILEQEFQYVKKGMTIYNYSHFSGSKELTLDSMTSLADFVPFETVMIDGKFPLLAPMSKIAGRRASWYAAEILNGLDRERQKEIKEKVKKFEEFDQYFEVPEDMKLESRDSVVFGGGIAGFYAAQMALVQGARKVTVTETNPERREEIKALLNEYKGRIEVIDDVRSKLKEPLTKAEIIRIMNDPVYHARSDELSAMEAVALRKLLVAVKGSDFAVNTVYSAGATAITVADKELLEALKDQNRQKLFIDVSIDQGGGIDFVSNGKAVSRQTDHDRYVAVDDFGHKHVRIPNIPGSTPRVASEMLEDATVFLEGKPYLAELTAEGGYSQALRKHPELARGITKGKVTDAAVVRDLSIINQDTRAELRTAVKNLIKYGALALGGLPVFVSGPALVIFKPFGPVDGTIAFMTMIGGAAMMISGMLLMHIRVSKYWKTPEVPEFDRSSYQPINRNLTRMLQRYEGIRKYFQMSDRAYKEFVEPDKIDRIQTSVTVDREEKQIFSYRIKHDTSKGKITGGNMEYITPADIRPDKESFVKSIANPKELKIINAASYSDALGVVDRWLFEETLARAMSASLLNAAYDMDLGGAAGVTLFATVKQAKDGYYLVPVHEDIAPKYSLKRGMRVIDPQMRLRARIIRKVMRQMSEKSIAGPEKDKLFYNAFPASDMARWGRDEHLKVLYEQGYFKKNDLGDIDLALSHVYRRDKRMPGVMLTGTPYYETVKHHIDNYGAKVPEAEIWTSRMKELGGRDALDKSLQNIADLELELDVGYETAQAVYAARNIVGEYEDVVGELGKMTMKVDGFDQLTLNQKKLAYYFYKASVEGWNIYFGQKHKHARAVRDLLEEIIMHPAGIDKELMQKIKDYADRIWTYRSNYELYTMMKFVPEFTYEELLDAALQAKKTGAFKGALMATSLFDSINENVKMYGREELVPPVPFYETYKDGDAGLTEAALIYYLGELQFTIFDHTFEPLLKDKTPRVDKSLSSAGNFTENVSDAQREAYKKPGTVLGK